MILLTPEESRSIYNYAWESGAELAPAHALAKVQLRKAVEWGDEPCPHCKVFLPKRVCDECWAELKKEAGL